MALLDFLVLAIQVNLFLKGHFLLFIGPNFCSCFGLALIFLFPPLAFVFSHFPFYFISSLSVKCYDFWSLTSINYSSNVV